MYERCKKIISHYCIAYKLKRGPIILFFYFFNKLPLSYIFFEWNKFPKIMFFYLSNVFCLSFIPIPNLKL
jgi:hypothetical protein